MVSMSVMSVALIVVFVDIVMVLGLCLVDDRRCRGWGKTGTISAELIVCYVLSGLYFDYQTYPPTRDS